jgi:hypothetical protein
VFWVYFPSTLDVYPAFPKSLQVPGSSGGDKPLKRLAELAFHPLESSKNSSLLTGLLRMNF